MLMDWFFIRQSACLGSDLNTLAISLKFIKRVRLKELLTMSIHDV